MSQGVGGGVSVRLSGGTRGECPPEAPPRTAAALCRPGVPDTGPPPYVWGRPTLHPDLVPDSEVTGSALHRGL